MRGVRLRRKTHQETTPRLSLPFPFISKRVGTEGSDKERRAKNADGRRVGFRGLQLRNRSGWHWEQEKRTPPEFLRFPAGFVDWADEPYSDPRLSPRACLNRQAGFTAARPAANWMGSVAAWKMPTHNLEISGRFCGARGVGEALRRDVDCGLADWSGSFRPCVVRKIG